MSPLVADNICASNRASLTITTGHADCYAYFNPALYHLGLIRDGVEEKIDLGFSGSRLLARLAQKPGEVVTREELMSYAWPGRVVGQGSLNQQIYTLRQILGDEKARAIILTLPRRGYHINPDLLSYVTDSANADEADLDIEPAIEPAAIPAPSHPLPQRQRPPPVVFAILGVIGACLLAFAYFGNFSTALHNRELQLGKLTIIYMDEDKSRLQYLMQQTSPLASRLAHLAQQPMRLFLGESGGIYEILCMQSNGSARSLIFPDGQLDHIADEQLHRCLS
jgi:DNA-binding winged helix-turn-helix (wHTH) protein